MATKDDSAPAGLLSRVVRFVRNPSSGFNEADAHDADRESSYSKQMLKEMIERKRRNDFVRKREFDMLRKMRRSEVLAGQDPGLRPSFFQSSMPSKPDDRATTLKKIDEIEAQMSMQWWKTKHGNSQMPHSGHSGSTAGSGGSGYPMSAHAATEGVRPAAPAPAATSYSRTSPQELAPKPAAAPEPMQPLFDSGLPETTQAMGLVPLQATPPLGRPAAPAVSDLPRDAAAAGAPSGPSTFSPSKQFAIQVEEFAHDPELEEASIRFANGDNEGAEAGLLEVLGPNGTRINHDETWLTLFDLYRAAGWHDRFESAAIDFAGRFGRSAPQWFSMPEIVAKMNTPAPAPQGAQDKADWTSPAVFGTQTLAALNAALARGTQPYKLNWSKLNSIAEAAAEPLTKLFTQWAGQNVQLRFIGADTLEKVLREATPSSDRSVNAAWWRLRMEVLRVMHRPDEFELVALDYCVTYEVSPPSWESARCDYKSLQPDGSLASRNTIIGEAFRDSVMSSAMPYGDSQMPGASSQMSSVATVELSGQILGDGKEALDLLDAKLGDADIMIISCARLMRIDFTAAGTLLNWVTAREVDGRQVQFSDVHRLVAAFFNVIGISEHARITIRNE
ncbi:STAS domain-containing protein [Ramlibacter ginsenosidimutans]|uniref:STAS domain-containing protein n=1 Tax=Ramlibacter ginsenosidimutans TaxID=502333 RepID=A0A934WKH2_9BURK|nr:STAS domain-containing protein [Ramlibacter ginsenosidimutans]MBK6004476.1 STAS domain-containing protein [Ramlibacter ginsenosidimutans]